MTFDFEKHRAEALSDYARIRPTYERLAFAVRDLLRITLDQEDVGWQAIDARAKAIESFADKAVRSLDSDPSEPKYLRPLQDIEDMAGVRAITFFRSDVPRVAELIRQEFDVLQEEDIGKSLIDQGRIGYQSVHFIVRLPRTRSSLREHRDLDGLKAEIQLRTLLQHAWAEIQHDLEYKSGLVVPTSIHRRFMELAGLIEIGDREFDAIQREHQGLATLAPSDLIDEVPSDGSPAELAEESAPEFDWRALKAYLDEKFGRDGRMAQWSYHFAARIAAALGFSSREQLDLALGPYDDDEISRALYGSRVGQVSRFEVVLLAALGEKFIERHPWNDAAWFRQMSTHRLDVLRARGFRVGAYDPLGDGTQPNVS